MRVAQGGINFSGGQRQRLAIARAVIRGRQIYLFDDAFSALDVHTDAGSAQRWRDMSADATVIIVAQRISTVATADQMIVIDDGKSGGRRHPRARCWPTAHLRASSPSPSRGARVGGPQ
jgi:ATP-binding cassette subfamily B multidrug efflux pump